MECDSLLKGMVILEKPSRTCFGTCCMGYDSLLNNMIIMEGP